MSRPRVTLYHAAGCHLCDRALTVLEAARDELGFDLELVDIGGDPELEARYRERLPVIEIDGERDLHVFVAVRSAPRSRLSAASRRFRRSGSTTPGSIVTTCHKLMDKERGRTWRNG